MSAKRLSDAELFADRRKTIQSFVRSNAKGNDILQKFASLAEAIRNFETIEKDYETISRAWGNRAAEEILSRKNFFALTGQKRLNYKVEGCMDAAIAFVASARTLAEIAKIPAKVFFVRMGSHSLVRIEAEGKNILYDPSIHRPNREIRGKLAEVIKKYKTEGKYAEGFGPREIGLRTLSDFHRYSMQ